MKSKKKQSNGIDCSFHSKRGAIPKTLQSKWALKEPLYIAKKDKRYNRFKNQLKTNGFCDAETWGLDSVICQFVLPRLQRFKMLNNGHPSGFTPEQWDATIDKMIFAFDWSLNFEDRGYYKLSGEEQQAKWKQYEEGMELFAKYFRDLWW